MQEFDRENTQHVRQLFSALDELLYEGKVCSKSESLRKECEEWNAHSPHLRYTHTPLHVFSTSAPVSASVFLSL